MTGNRFLLVLVITVILFASVPVSSAFDYTLGIFGNANEDDTINIQDVECIESVIFELDDQTQLADANYDGGINILDMTHIELIILGEEKKITIMDGNEEALTVQKPVERIIVEYLDNAELVRVLNRTDRVVGVDFIINETRIQFPVLSKRSCVGAMHEPDYEKVLSLNPDLLLTFSSSTSEKKEKLPGVDVVFLGMYYPDLADPENSRFTGGVRKLGYILNANDAAGEYLNWRMGWINKIKSKTREIPENEKQKVFVCAYQYPHTETTSFKTYTGVDTLTQMATLAGGKCISDILPEFTEPAYQVTVDPEWLIEQNPDYIIIHAVRYTYSGMTLDPAHGYDADDPAGLKKGRDEFMNRPELANVNAVKNGNVYILSGNFRNDATGGFMGAAYMAKIFYPDIFYDLDPQALHQEYLSRFQSMDYDLNKHGVFVYPPLGEI
ncbi:MAG: ABC transporter substrate-binding protein [Methanosarcinaceae archaeon]